MRFMNYKTVNCKIKEGYNILDVTNGIRRKMNPDEFFFIYGRLHEAETDYFIDGVGNIFTLEFSADLLFIQCNKDALEIIKVNSDVKGSNLNFVTKNYLEKKGGN